MLLCFMHKRTLNLTGAAEGFGCLLQGTLIKILRHVRYFWESLYVWTWFCCKMVLIYRFWMCHTLMLFNLLCRIFVKDIMEFILWMHENIDFLTSWASSLRTGRPNRKWPDIQNCRKTFWPFTSSFYGVAMINREPETTLKLNFARIRRPLQRRTF